MRPSAATNAVIAGFLGASVGVGVGAGVAGGVGGIAVGSAVGAGGGGAATYRTTTVITRIGTMTAPPSISGGTSSGRDSPLTITSALPTVTLIALPGFAISIVLVDVSNVTLPPICSNIERSGTSTVPQRGEHAPGFEVRRRRIDVPIVEEDRIAAGRRRSKIR
jgi:hypothetical protein